MRGTSLPNLAGHQNGINYLDDAIGLIDVGNGDHRGAALGVGDGELLAAAGEGEGLALNGLEGCLAAAVLVSLAACSSMNGTGAAPTPISTNTLIQPTPPSATPNLPGN